MELPGSEELEAFLRRRYGDARLGAASEEKCGLRLSFMTMGKKRELLLVPYGPLDRREGSVRKLYGKTVANASELSR